MKEKFQILSLDGGGLKGLFTAAVLAAFEEDCNTTIVDHFDLIAGTSTGGIIALALGAGIRPAEIVKFYTESGPEIFPRDWKKTLNRLLITKFESANLEKHLQKYLKERLLGSSTKRLLIPSYNLGEDNVYLFKTPHHERFRRDYKLPMWQVAMATSAAPTYLPTFKKIQGLRLVDGGVWANNPVVLAILEATSILEQPLDSIKALSIGTTNDLRDRPWFLDSGGLALWANDVADLMLNAQSVGAIAQAKHLIGKDNVIRMNPTVKKGKFRLDKLSEELQSKAADFSRHNSPIFKETFMSHSAHVYTPIYSEVIK
jgi:patatin-like phospholipase/acyl hydrolase